MNLIRIAVFLLLLGLPIGATAQQEPAQWKSVQSDALKLFQSIQGKWKGTCKTWFVPNRLADESEVAGEFKLILNQRFLRHTYQGKIRGKARTGEETVVFNSMRRKFQVTWIDDFHMSYGILFSTGEPRKNGFSVVGSYSVGKDQPEWKWRTVYELSAEDELTITSFNITPQGKEAKAVEIKYKRIK